MTLTTIAAATVGDYATGFAAIGTMLVLGLQALRSWRQGPATASLTEAQVATERDKGWQNMLAEVRASLVEARAEADRANDRVDMVTTQIDALRRSKDEMELSLASKIRAERDRGDALAARVGRLEAQLHAAGLTPVD